MILDGDYTVVYSQTHYGTERMVVVRDHLGKIVGRPRDPFWPIGVPASANDRKHRILHVARSIIADAKAVPRD